jgi:hypothetical protein
MHRGGFERGHRVPLSSMDDCFAMHVGRDMPSALRDTDCDQNRKPLNDSAWTPKTSLNPRRRAGAPAIGLVPVRLGSSFAWRFAPQDEGNVDIPKQARRIDRGERRLSEPTPEPSSQFKLVEPQRRAHERREELLSLRCVETRPALHRRPGQINAPHVASLIEQRKIEKRKTQICGKGGVARSPH